LQAWLSALAAPISALAFRPLDHLVAEADRRLYEVEGRALEKLVRQLYEERSRLGIGDFPLIQEHASRFLSAQQKYQGWNIQFVGVAPKLEKIHRVALKNHGILGQDLMDLTAEML
jgi:hypothetical protein